MDRHNHPDSMYTKTEYSSDEIDLQDSNNESDNVTFHTPNDADYQDDLKISPGEVFIVGMILAAWFSALALFLHKWSKIHSIQPEPRYQHEPKNLDTIKVVKRPTDSVIYKSPSRKTMKKKLFRTKYHAPSEGSQQSEGDVNEDFPGDNSSDCVKSEACQTLGDVTMEGRSTGSAIIEV